MENSGSVSTTLLVRELRQVVSLILLPRDTAMVRCLFVRLCVCMSVCMCVETSKHYQTFQSF